MGEQVTVTRRHYERVMRDRDQARSEADWLRKDAASTERWAHEAFDEQRRLSDRLTAVVAAAASLGVPITAINAALSNPPPAADVQPEQVETEGVSQ